MIKDSLFSNDFGKADLLYHTQKYDQNGLNTYM